MIEYAPSVEVVVATLVPFTDTVTPKRGFVSGPVTFPLTLVWANVKLDRQRKPRKANICFAFLTTQKRFFIKQSFGDGIISGDKFINKYLMKKKIFQNMLKKNSILKENKAQTRFLNNIILFAYLYF